jgi:outer membrane protein assembly factor BamB
VDLDRDQVLSRSEWTKNVAGMAAENGLLAFRLGGKGEFTRVRSQVELTTLDPATGAVLKQGRLREAVDQYYASPVAADGKVFFVSRTGIASVLKAGAEQEVLAVADFDEEVVATPAIADGRLYLRTKSALYCFGSAGP